MRGAFVLFFALFSSIHSFSQNCTDPPSAQGATICQNAQATILVVSPGNSYEWYDAPTGGNLLSTSKQFQTPPLTTTTYYYVQYVGENCVSPRAAIPVVVLPTPGLPVIDDVFICSGTSITLSISGPGGTYEWFTTPTGGSPFVRSPDFTTPVLTATTTYYVQTSSGDCQSPRKPVTVNVKPLPQPATVTPASICYGNTATLTASVPVGNLSWYDAPSATSPLATGTSFTTPVLTQTTTYYVETENNGCVSSRVPVTATVNAIPREPTVSGAIVCSGNATTLTALGPGGTYSWFDAATGGNLLGTGTSYATGPLTASRTYYVESTIAGCTGPRATVQVTVLQTVAAPSSSASSTCAGTRATLNATGSPGSYAWYNSASGGTLLGTGGIFVTPVLNTSTTFYVESTLQGCASSRVPVPVTVNPRPAAPVTTGASVCPGNTALLSATASGGTIEWYDAPAGGNLLGSGLTFTTPALTTTTTYYAQLSANPCNSNRVAVVATVATPPADPLFDFASPAYYTGNPNPSPQINAPGGTFSSVPAGLSINPLTGLINIGASADGNYTITYTLNGACTFTSTDEVAINPVATLSYDGPLCQYAANPLPHRSPGIPPGTYSSTTGLVIDPVTGTIDLTRSVPGTYVVTETIPPTGNYPGSVLTANVVIVEGASANAGPDQIVGPGVAINLAGLVLGANVQGWTGGAGTFVNAGNANATYMPAPGELTATLRLTTTDPPTSCGPVYDEMVVSIISDPVVAGATVCFGTSATLSVGGGGTIEWYDAPVNGNLLYTGADFPTPALTSTTIYHVLRRINGIASNRTPATVTVITVPPAPVIAPATICAGQRASLLATGSDSYRWFDAASGGNLLSTSPAFTTPVLSAQAVYYVEGITGGCSSTRTPVVVTVNPLAAVISATDGEVCSGTALNYQMQSSVAGTTFTWSRAAVAGITNPPLSGQAGPLLTETLVNISGSDVHVVYVITPSASGCTGTPLNYTVIVHPDLTVTSSATKTVCNNDVIDYAISFNIPGVSYSWSRAGVAGIQNPGLVAQTAPVIREQLINTTNAPVSVTYTFTYNIGPCTGAPFNVVVTVNPTVRITSAAFTDVCTESAENYQITSDVPSATFSWSRAAVAGISNPAVSGQTSTLITETLVNTTFEPVLVYYVITPTAFGCSTPPFYYLVTVYPKPPVIASNSPVCAGSSILLTSTDIPNAVYNWTGPNGFTSTERNPVIPLSGSINAGVYTLRVVANGCTGNPVTTNVVVEQPPVVAAGADQVVCADVVSVVVSGTITGGSGQVLWSSSGSGTFSPSASSLNASYLPSAGDRSGGSVTLTLRSVNNLSCPPASDALEVSLRPYAVVNAGPDQNLCSQVTSVSLSGAVTIASGGIWSTTGSGTFVPSATQMNVTYLPSASDIASGKVVLSLTSTGNIGCPPVSDPVNVRFIPPPTVDAGHTRYKLFGRALTLEPNVSDPNVTYRWTPNLYLSNDAIKNPVVTAASDVRYTLTVTDARGCVNSDTVFVKVLQPLTIPNTFTPNGDGVNDLWNIPELAEYPSPVIRIFNRLGENVFTANSYQKPWNGFYKGKPLPVGVYYYVIQSNVEGITYSGYITLIR